MIKFTSRTLGRHHHASKRIFQWFIVKHTIEIKTKPQKVFIILTDTRVVGVSCEARFAQARETSGSVAAHLVCAGTRWSRGVCALVYILASRPDAGVALVASAHSTHACVEARRIDVALTASRDRFGCEEIETSVNATRGQINVNENRNWFCRHHLIN